MAADSGGSAAMSMQTRKTQRGTPTSAHKARERRGTIMVLILGGLALISVATVAYVVLGRSDRSKSGQMVQRADIDADIAEIRSYLTGVISDDVFDTVFELNANASGVVEVREAWDYPATSYGTESVPSGGAARFSASGTGDDPWLADTLPTWLDWAGDKASIDSFEWWLYRADWGNISNFAPDGRFVNLHNLRLDFDAKPGIGAGEMSDNLSLLEDNGSATFDLDYDEPSDNNIPGHWSNRQRRAFRPVLETQYGPNNANYRNYQWADADGDGMLDSRLFELVDFSDPQNVDWKLQPQKNRRIFVAARAIDLSSMVNVNVGTDFRDAPDEDYPVGRYPSDIDLRRLLSMDDIYDEGYDGSNELLGYHNFIQPVIGGPSNYFQSTSLEMSLAGTSAFEALSRAFENNKIPPPGDFTMAPAMDVADRSDHYFDSAGYFNSARFDASGSGSSILRGSTIAGPAEMLELLTRRGLNDPKTTTRLERVLGGAWSPDYPWLSVVRANRISEVERPSWDINGDGLPDPYAMIWSASDIRQLLTVYSGARPIRSRAITAGNRDTITQSDLPRDALSPLQSLLSGGDRLKALRTIHAGYKEALLPHMAEPGAWEPANQSVHYGFDPASGFIHNGILSQRIAAHMALNLIDSYDEDDEPTVIKLMMHQDINPNFSNFDPLTTLPDSTLPDQGQFDSLDPSGADLEAALNVYGIEIQPFITEIASFAIYSDDAVAPPPPPPSPIPGEIPFWPIEINGTNAYTNDEFIMEAIAFQITNPFDEPINLSNLDTNANEGDALASDDEFLYYIEYGGNSYKLASHTAAGDQEVVVLGPGESRVFYALGQDYDQVALRWDNGARDVPSTTVGANGVPIELQEWLNEQMTADNPPIRITQFDTASGTLTPMPTGNGSFTLHSATNAENLEVRLWRKLVAPTGENSANDPTNDMLADRFRDPAAVSTLNRFLDSGTQTIEGTQNSESWRAVGNQRGLSITLWASVARLTDPSPAPLGALPAYCMEVKYGSSSNYTDEDPLGTDRSDPPYDEFVRTLSDALDEPAHIQTLTQNPQSKTNAYGSGSFEYTEIPLAPLSVADLTSRLRVADLLAPLGIGPYHAPAADDRLTLGEAIAIVSGLENDTDIPASSVLRGLGVAATSPLPLGNLRLRDYVSYVNGDANPVFDPANDQRRGPGIPLALNILNAFTTLDQDFVSHTRATVGTININTAPAHVLRTLPMLAPTNAGSGSGTDEWWDTAGSVGSGLDRNTDIAAGLIAYRDKLTEALRQDLNQTPQGFLPVFNENPTTPDNPAGFAARSSVTSIPALREDPGFRSVGEVMALTFPGSTPVSMDALGVDGDPIDVDGVVSHYYPASSSTPDELIDEIDEKLAIANGLMNSISVRSDLFAVWFVVHAYDRDDVEGLKATEPMVPSIARRFVMVLDRSNVTSRGDEPRVVLFSELPL